MSYFWDESSGQMGINLEECVMLLHSLGSEEPAQTSCFPPREVPSHESPLHVPSIAEGRTLTTVLHG